MAATTASGATLVLRHKGGHGRPKQWSVEMDGRVIGLVEHWLSGKTTATPWWGYAGMGREAISVGCFYSQQGGKEAAIAAVLAAHDSAPLPIGGAA